MTEAFQVDGGLLCPGLVRTGRFDAHRRAADAYAGDRDTGESDSEEKSEGTWSFKVDKGPG